MLPHRVLGTCVPSAAPPPTVPDYSRSKRQRPRAASQEAVRANRGLETTLLAASNPLEAWAIRAAD